MNSDCVCCELENAKVSAEFREEIFTCECCGDSLCESCLLKEAERHGVEMPEATLIFCEASREWRCPACFAGDQ